MAYFMLVQRNFAFNILELLKLQEMAVLQSFLLFFCLVFKVQEVFEIYGQLLRAEKQIQPRSISCWDINVIPQAELIFHL